MILRSLAAVAAVLALLSCSGRQSAAANAPPPSTSTVVIEALRFQPETLTVKAGDTIIWVNKDPFPHTATSPASPAAARSAGRSDPGQAPARNAEVPGPGIDSKEIAAGASWKYTAATKGEFPYVCSLHPTMKAVLRVE